MANGRHAGRLVRKVVAGVLGTIAAFIILFGAGRGSWAVAALGLALLVLAISLVAVDAFRGGTRAWVAGTAHVVNVSEPPASSVYGRCELQLLINAPGLPAAAVKVRDPQVPVAKWPDVGATLPILVAIDDLRRVRIQWDDVLTHAEASAAEAQGAGYPTVEDSPGEGDDPGLFDRDPTPGAQAADDLTGTEDLDDPRDPMVAPDTPGEPTVLEGTVIKPDAPPTVPLPRRARRPSPRPRRPPADASGAPAAGTALADPPGAADTVQGPADSVQGPADSVQGPADSVQDPTGTAPNASDAMPETADVTADSAGGPTGTAQTATDPADAATDTAGRAAAADGGTPDEVTDVDGEEILADLITAYPSARPGPAGPIHGVGITILVTDLEQSVAFYRETLGFHEIDGGEGNAVLASGDTRLVLRTLPNAEPVHRRTVHLNLEVCDVEAVYQELRAKGIRFTYGPRPVNQGERLELWAAAFRDPDGHGIALTQWRGRTPI